MLQQCSQCDELIKTLNIDESSFKNFTYESKLKFLKKMYLKFMADGKTDEYLSLNDIKFLEWMDDFIRDYIK
jgi:hypothetical protein